MQDMDELVLNILGTLYGDADLKRHRGWRGFPRLERQQISARRMAAGDFNCDGLVDGQDFLVWNANKFQTGTGGTALVAGRLAPTSFSRSLDKP